jgi:hypothetical protein
MVVASEGGGYFLRVALVRPANFGKKPLVRALSSVEMAGDQREAWLNLTRFAGWAPEWCIAGKALAGVAMSESGALSESGGGGVA